MAGIKRWWFEKSIVPQMLQSHYFHGRSNQHIGVVTDVCENFPGLNEFIQEERSRNNKVNLLQLKLDKSLVTPDEAAYTIGSKNVNWYGIPKGKATQYFLDHNYDICYFPIQNVSLPAEYILRSVKSGLKLGFVHKEYTPFLDYSIDSKEEVNQQFKFLLESASNLLFGSRKPA